jgi:hypothetical protein
MHLIIIMVAVLSLTVPMTVRKETEGIRIADADNLSLILDFGNGTLSSYEELQGSTVLNVTEEVVDIEYEWYGNMAFVTSIASVANDPELGLWWQYWVNGDIGSVAANHYSVDHGDTIEWRFGPAETTATTTTTPGEIDRSLLFGLPLVGLAAVVFLIVLRLSVRK